MTGVLEEGGGGGGVGGGAGHGPPLNLDKGRKKGHIFFGLIWPISY